ncbi:hypothetical protein GGU11DRAFT_812620 [Lentinula aff. detonsa]|nr:hypothetical protein GGU11DRAFT_812620 [Lentinula aff. detonsa]
MSVKLLTDCHSRAVNTTLSYKYLRTVKAVQPERITIEVPEASDEVPSVGTVTVTQGCTRKGYTVLGSMMGLQGSFRQCSLHAIWVSLRSAKKKEVPERRTSPIDRSGCDSA